MVAILVVIHTLVSIGLIFVILLHSGRGAGLSSVFGGGLSSSFGGTGVIEKNLNRITIALSVLFAITTILLIIVL
jgi:preprotein translocase subunit SecG